LECSDRVTALIGIIAPARPGRSDGDDALHIPLLKKEARGGIIP